MLAFGLTPAIRQHLWRLPRAGKSEDDAARIRADARALADAGASVVLMECVPAALASAITAELPVPPSALAPARGQRPGAGDFDMLGVYPGKKPVL